MIGAGASHFLPSVTKLTRLLLPRQTRAISALETSRVSIGRRLGSDASGSHNSACRSDVIEPSVRE
ncbi:hypothetical protein A1351_12720 [Methylosinus sp. R-45379]|nr:hypothetical protein A1351_12720 [Methylosinus sp. R-45379]